MAATLQQTQGLQAGRAAAEPVRVLRKPFNGQGFHWGRVRDECFWGRMIGGIDTDFFFHKSIPIPLSFTSRKSFPFSL